MRRFPIIATDTSSRTTLWYDKGKVRDCKRVTTDGSEKFNTLIVYEEGDEIYEHWDAMYVWEERPEEKKLSSLKDWVATEASYSPSTAGILLSELARYREKMKGETKIPEVPIKTKKELPF